MYKNNCGKCVISGFVGALSFAVIFMVSDSVIKEHQNKADLENTCMEEVLFMNLPHYRLSSDQVRNKNRIYTSGVGYTSIKNIEPFDPRGWCATRMDIFLSNAV